MKKATSFVAGLVLVACFVTMAIAGLLSLKRGDLAIWRPDVLLRGLAVIALLTIPIIAGLHLVRRLDRIWPPEVIGALVMAAIAGSRLSRRSLR